MAIVTDRNGTVSNELDFLHRVMLEPEIDPLGIAPHSVEIQSGGATRDFISVDGLDPFADPTAL